MFRGRGTVKVKLVDTSYNTKYSFTIKVKLVDTYYNTKYSFTIKVKAQR